MEQHSNKISKSMKLGFAAMAALGAMAHANDAMALNRGCQDANLVRTGMATEGQFVLVSAISPIPAQPKNIFTSNANGTVGYNIEQGTGDQVGKLCVGIKYTDIKVNGDANLATPSWALFGANTTHDQWLLQTQARTNERILMGATVLRDVNGQDVRGGFMMVTRGDVSASTTTINNGGAVTLTVNNGEIRPTLVLGNVEKVQPNYDVYASRTSQVASNSRPMVLAKN
jgi:hypothetical protein